MKLHCIDSVSREEESEVGWAGGAGGRGAGVDQDQRNEQP